MNASQTLTAPHQEQPDLSLTSIRRFSLDEYHRLIELDFFDEDERVELIDGMIVPMSPPKPRHAETVDLVLYSLSPLFAVPGVLIRVQSPITLPDQDVEPEPDLVVIRPERRDLQRHPLPHEVLLVVEVADSSLTRDQTVKALRYARAGLPEYWLVNLIENRLEVYRDPVTVPGGSGEYRTRTFYRAGDVVAPLSFPDHEVHVSTFLPVQEEPPDE